jgi:preprotein translocase subunit SecY
MIADLKNFIKVKELRDKILWTLFILALARLLQNIPLPHIDKEALDLMQTEIANARANNSGQIFNMVNVFSGGALQKLSIGALGIMPYITASIVVQLMAPVIPALEKMQKDGINGRQRISQITRYATIVISLFQAIFLAKALPQLGDFSQQIFGFQLPPGTILIHDAGFGFMITTVLVLTGTALLITWLGEQITERGVGNGASILIMANILADAPAAFSVLIGKWNPPKFALIHLILLFCVMIAAAAATVVLVQTLRKIPLKYARKAGGADKVLSEKTSFLPLKLNHAGVMPVIFASALMMVPNILLQNIHPTSEIGKTIVSFLAANLSYGSFGFIIFEGVMILLFTFFWVATQFNPIQISDDLNRSGGFIPGVRPGEPTSDYLNSVMTRITVAGGLFLVVLATFPSVMNTVILKDPNMLLSQFFGGTSLLIMVGVILQTYQQFQVQVVQQNYDSIATTGRLRSREPDAP